MIENEIIVFIIFTLKYITINSQTTENFSKFLPSAVEDSNNSVPNILEPNDSREYLVCSAIPKSISPLFSTLQTVTEYHTSFGQ
jgi:hypothetical protein